MNEGIESLERSNKLDSGQLTENCVTAETERVNNETTQQSTEPTSNLTTLVAEAQNPQHNVLTESNSSTTSANNITLLEPLLSKVSSPSKHKGLSGKYSTSIRRLCVFITNVFVF